MNRSIIFLIKSLSMGVLCYSFFIANAIAQTDTIKSVQVQEQIGLTQVPLIQVDVTLTKPRELYVAIQDMTTWKTVARSKHTIEVSENYYFELPIDDIKPGKYRVDAYLAPKGKGFKEKLSKPVRAQFAVIDAPTYVIPLNLSAEDKVRQVLFPKVVNGKEDVTLTVKYDVQAPRNLHIKLLSSDNWKEFGALKFPLKESGEKSIPFSNMTDDFPAGNYAWVVTITELGKKEPSADIEPSAKKEPLAKMGKQFELKDNDK